MHEARSQLVKACMAGDHCMALTLESSLAQAVARLGYYGELPAIANVARPFDGRVHTAQRWLIDVLLPVPFWTMLVFGGCTSKVVTWLSTATLASPVWLIEAVP